MSGDIFGCHNLWRGRKRERERETQREILTAPTSFPTCCFNHHKAYNSGAVSTRTMLCTPRFTTPKRDLVPIKQSLSIPLLQPLRPINVTSVSTALLILDIPYKCRHALCDFWCPASFSEFPRAAGTMPSPLGWLKGGKKRNSFTVLEARSLAWQVLSECSWRGVGFLSCLPPASRGLPALLGVPWLVTASISLSVSIIPWFFPCVSVSPLDHLVIKTPALLREGPLPLH